MSTTRSAWLPRFVITGVGAVVLALGTAAPAVAHDGGGGDTPSAHRGPPSPNPASAKR